MLAALALAMQATIAVPDAVRLELDAICAGWRLAAVLPEIAEEIATRTPSWPPNLLPGDFNGDGETDVALLVDCGGRVQLLAFLTGGRGFTKAVLEPPQPHDARQFLYLIRGEYGHHAIGVEYDAIGGHAWVLRDGTWRSIPR